MEIYTPIIKGIAIAAVLGALGLGIEEWRWWVAMLAFNIAIQI